MVDVRGFDVAAPDPNLDLRQGNKGARGASWRGIKQSLGAADNGELKASSELENASASAT